jgi:hypothetical protein
LFEEVDGAEGAIGVDGGDHEGDGSCADVESGDERGLRSGGGGEFGFFWL